MKKYIFIIFIFSIIFTNHIYAQNLVQFDFKVTPKSPDTCITNTATVSKDSSSPSEGQSSTTTKVGSPTTDCFAGSTTPAGWPTHGFLTQGPQGGTSHFTCCYNPGITEAVDIADMWDDPNPPVYATFNAKVVEAYDCTLYGTCGAQYGTHVLLGDDANIFTVMFGHFSQLSVVTGQQVNRGDVIGIMGETGYAFGIHTHMEFRSVPGGLAPPNIPEPIDPEDCDNGKSTTCSPSEINFDPGLGPPPPTTTDNYWFLLDQLNKKEYLFNGPFNVRDSKYLVKESTVLPGLLGDTPTPVPSKVTPTREYWTLKLATLAGPVSYTPGGQPGFLRLDIENENASGGPIPYLECGPSGTTQCYWGTAGDFGLHGVDKLHPLTDPGSAGCIRHSNADIKYLYDLLSTKVNDKPFTIRYYIEDGVIIN